MRVVAFDNQADPRADQTASASEVTPARFQEVMRQTCRLCPAVDTPGESHLCLRCPLFELWASTQADPAAARTRRPRRLPSHQVPSLRSVGIER